MNVTFDPIADCGTTDYTPDGMLTFRAGKIRVVCEPSARADEIISSMNAIQEFILKKPITAKGVENGKA